MSSTKREIRTFHVVIVQRRQRNVQKRVMHVHCCCFANLNLLLFCRSRSRRRRRCLSSLISYPPPPPPPSSTCHAGYKKAWKYSASTLPTVKTFGCWSIEGLTFIPINHWYLFIHIWAEVERVNLERSILSSELRDYLKALFARSSHINKNSRVKQREWWQNYLTGKHATYPNQPWWSAVRGREWNPSLYPVQQPWERTNIMWKQFAYIPPSLAL